MLWITTGNQQIINHHCRKRHSKNTHYRRYSSPFACYFFGIDTLDLRSRHQSCLFHPCAKGTREGTSLHFPKLCSTDILRIKFTTSTHTGIYFASRLCSAVEKQNLAFHHINSIHHNIILREVERVRCFYIILAFYGLHICFGSDTKQALLHLEDFALSYILIGGYHLTIEIGGVHFVEIYKGQVSKAVIIRTAWLYSTFGNNFVKTMLRLGQEREALGVVFDQIGSPTYAADLAMAIFAAINAPVWQPGVYHFTNEGVCSWYDFTHEIFARAQSLLGKETADKIASCHLRPILSSEYQYQTPRPHYSVLSKTKIKQTLGIAIPHWTEALQVCLEKLLQE